MTLQALLCPVLLVRDDAPTRVATVQALAARGCEAIETADAEFALHVLRTRPDIRSLVAAAHQLGMLTGYELARIADREWPAIRHVVVIGSEPPEPAALPLGAHFLRRPLDVAALLRCLEGPGAARTGAAGRAWPG